MMGLVPVDEEELKAKWWLDREYDKSHRIPMFWEAGREWLILKPKYYFMCGLEIGSFDITLDREDIDCLTVLCDADNEDTEIVAIRGSIQELVEDICSGFETVWPEPNWRPDSPGWNPEVTLEEAKERWHREGLLEREKAADEALRWADLLESKAQEIRHRVETWQL